MSFLLFNGSIPVLRASLSFPRFGAWHGEIVLDTEEALDVAGPAALTLEGGSATWTATITRGGVFGGKARAWVVGGAGGLSRRLAPRFYRGVPLRLPVQDLLLEVGERLSATADPALLSALLPAWTRMERVAGALLSELVGAFGAPWRVLPSGEVWLGLETWAPFGGDFVVLDEDPGAGWADVDADPAELGPGVTLDGRRVGRLGHEFGPWGLRSRVWFEA
jgi:hypothetical protein